MLSSKKVGKNHDHDKHYPEVYSNRASRIWKRNLNKYEYGANAYITSKKYMSKDFCFHPKSNWGPSVCWNEFLFHFKKSSLKNVSFPGSWKTGTGFSQPRVHTVMDRTSARRAWVLPITVWMSGWHNHFRFFNFLEEAFSVI